MKTNTNQTIINDEVYGVCIINKKDDKPTLYTPTKSRIESLQKYGNTSDSIRMLLKEGKSRKEVSEILNIRYQHVRNVELQILKKK